MRMSAERLCALAGAAGLCLLLSACATAPAPGSAPASSDPQVPFVTTGQRSGDIPKASASSSSASNERPVDPAITTTPGSAQPPQDGALSSTEAGDLSDKPEQGIASWYGPRFHGRRTASGELYDMHAMTAAHKTLPFGTRVRVKSLVNGKEITVRINDRGPFIKGRIIDLSRAAAQAIGMPGVKQVQVTVLR